MGRERGGQVEIVGEPALVYDTEEQASDRIARVLNSPPEQQRLRDHLAARAELFGTDRFVAEVQAIVRAFKK